MYAKQLHKDNGNAAFTKMKVFLEKVYGVPRSVGLMRGEFNISWALQSTTIRLHSNAADYMTIIYEERTDKESSGS